MSDEERRHIVWMPGEPAWELPPAVAGRCLGGGHRVLHELAVAIAATGRTVEVRGEFDFDELNVLSDAAGAAPECPSDPRLPTEDDVILMPEGVSDPLVFAMITLSAARRILLVLAPPGLFGWPFVEGWSLRPAAAVDLEQVARPEHFRAMGALGFELWANSPGLVERIHAAGESGTWIGVGRPVAFPEPLPKRWDVVTLAHNRWSQLAAHVVGRLEPGIEHHEIPAGDNDELLRQFGQARILVHPLRVEGDSRIGQEARAMGAVPVVLNTNPFSVGLDEASGAVAVASLGEMPEAVMELLGDPGRLEELRQRGLRSVREQFDWEPYVDRVDAALRERRPGDPGAQARAVFGGSFRSRERWLVEQVQAEMTDEREQLRGRLEWDIEVLQADLAAVKHTLHTVQSTRIWRLAGQFWKLRDRVLSAFGSGTTPGT